jgi:hypothetical protein
MKSPDFWIAGKSARNSSTGNSLRPENACPVVEEFIVPFPAILAGPSSRSGLDEMLLRACLII